MPLFPAFKRQRLENQHEFEASLGYIVILLAKKKRKREGKYAEAEDRVCGDCIELVAAVS